MQSDVNQRIIEKIDGGSFDTAAKGFLKLLLGYELEHFSESLWRYGSDYEREIMKAIRERRKR